MYPTICHIGPVSVHSFGVMVALSVIVCSLLMAREARRLSISSESIFDLVFGIMISGIIGARIFFIILNLDYFRENPADIIMVHQGGLAWQGGLIFAALTTLFFIKRRQWNLAVMADFIAPYLALGHAIGRVGCFLNGCCYGRHVGWGIYFPVHDAHLHPTQLYEMVFLLALFFGLKLLQRIFDKTPGAIFAIYLMAASAIRFGIEFFRADHQPLWLQLSIFQYVGIALFITGVVVLLRVRRKNV